MERKVLCQSEEHLRKEKTLQGLESWVGDVKCLLALQYTNTNTMNSTYEPSKLLET